MKPISKISEKTSVFVLEIKADEKTNTLLGKMGILPKTILTIISNDGDAVTIETGHERYVLKKETADTIIVSDILNNQERIFEGNQTKQREVILTVLKKIKGHFTLDELVRKVQKKDKNIGQITVYRALKTLTDKGILETISMPDGAREYEIIKGHHDHIICENCGAVYEFHDADLEQAQKIIAEQHGVVLADHKMQLFGRQCPKCND